MNVRFHHLSALLLGGVLCLAPVGLRAQDQGQTPNPDQTQNQNPGQDQGQNQGQDQNQDQSQGQNQNQDQNQNSGQAPGQSQTGQTPGADSGQNATSEPSLGLASENPPAESTAGESSSRVPVPLPLSLDADSMRFSNEVQERNYLRGGVSLGATYDDNLLSGTSNRVGSAGYSILPNILFDQARSRLSWTLGYAGGFVANQRYSAYNQASHDVGLDVRYRVSPHVNFHLRDHYTITSNFFEQLQGSPITPGGGGTGTGTVQQPNPTVITPLAKHNDELGTAEITWQFSAGDMVGASSTFYDSRFRDIPAGAGTLLDTQTEEGDGFYTHRFSDRNWTGVAYKFQRLTFNPATETVDTHSLFLFHTIYLKPRMAISVFAGPEYSTLNTQIISTVVTLPYVSITSVPTKEYRLSGAGGVSFSWQGQRTSASVSAARKVSDGGGLLSAVQLTGGTAEIRRQLTRTAAVSLGAVFGDNRVLDSGSDSGDLKSGSGSISFQQQIGRSFGASLGYARDYENVKFGSTLPENVNHNRGWVTLSYHFDRPLGR